VHADLYDWEPPAGPAVDLIFFAFLVAHPAERFEEFWDRLAGWLAPGGTVFFCDDVAGVDARRSDPGEPSTTRPRSRISRRLRTGVSTRS
jgi:hypothetical protein